MSDDDDDDEPKPIVVHYEDDRSRLRTVPVSQSRGNAFSLRAYGYAHVTRMAEQDRRRALIRAVRAVHGQTQRIVSMLEWCSRVNRSHNDEASRVFEQDRRWLDSNRVAIEKHVLAAPAASQDRRR